MCVLILIGFGTIFACKYNLPYMFITWGQENYFFAFLQKLLVLFKKMFYLCTLKLYTS